MAHTEKCPICKGRGHIEAGDKRNKCHGCDGKGWVSVGIEYPPPIKHPTVPNSREVPWRPDW